MQTDTHLW